jgi:hypothetical protein
MKLLGQGSRAGTFMLAVEDSNKDCFVKVSLERIHSSTRGRTKFQKVQGSFGSTSTASSAE